MSKNRMFLAGGVIVAFLTGGILVLSGSMAFAENEPVKQQSARKIDVKHLEGRWVRSDGGYVLELREIKKDGTLKASYFNPKPINVHQAKYQIKQGKISLFVELRDVNYPGSKYHLEYDPQSDKLMGSYFQAVDRQTYQIEFERSK